MSRRKKHKHRSGGPQGGPSSAPQNQQRSVSQQGHSSEARVIQAEQPQHPRGQAAIQSVMVPRRNIFKKQMHQRNTPPATKRYGVVFYETPQSARNDLANIQELSKTYDQLNIVIRAEPTSEDPELASLGKVFAGAAWTLIHERRVQDGWYDQPHE